VERELVFDIDLTDYDDVRNSGSGTSMSGKCWILMAIAIKVRSSLLRSYLPFNVAVRGISL
jgi:DNA primase small subunit